VNEALHQESLRLARSWSRHDAGTLQDYLIADVQDPRINVQSVLSRHVLLRAAGEPHYADLASAELRFAAAMNWVLATAKDQRGREALDSIRHALDRGADNADGVSLPFCLRRLHAMLPGSAAGLPIPDYLAMALDGTTFGTDGPRLPIEALDTFARLWRTLLASAAPTGLSVLEPACGSANDYRHLESYGLARLFDYRGIDLCETNISNARALFPAARFEVGNVFELDLPDDAVDYSFAHDLFEHLSPAGLTAAATEICRVTRHRLCLHFFNMDEIPETLVRPVDDYHWNTLSLGQIESLFASLGFAGDAMHIGTFLHRGLHCECPHNPRAYTLTLDACPSALPHAS